MSDEECASISPDTGANCTVKSSHALHVAPGSTWTDQDVEDAKDPNKVLVKAINTATSALNRVADSIEHYISETLHKVR